MTHFVSGGERTQKPESLTFSRKLQVLLAGVTMPRPVNRQTPSDFDLSFETVTLTNSRGIRLEAWRIPQPSSKGMVLLFHGYGASKDSLLPAAREFQKLGFETLLVDFYGSGGSQGNETSVGVHEADDVLAACQFARRQSPDRPLILYGVSMGAAAILRAVHIHKINPDTLILECPFDRLLSTVQNRFNAMQLPSFPSAQLLVFWGGVQQGYNGFDFSPADYVREVSCPVLLLHGEKDARVTLSQMNRLAQNLNPASRYRVFAGLEHQSYVSARPDEWRNYVTNFLADACRPRSE
jgi:alpha-beta hydrolase superfamily lysophospholipase